MGEIRSWKTALLLSIVVPIGFFAAFRLTGTLLGPVTISETATVETVAWSMERPSTITQVLENLTSSYLDEDIQAVSQSGMVGYFENDPDYPSWGNDYLAVRIRVRANVSGGFIYSMKIEFSETEADANLRIYGDFRAIELTGCRDRAVQLFGDSSRKAYFEAYGIDRPKNCSLGILIAWIFLDNSNADHHVTATFETIYFNGTVYKQVNIPISLSVNTDNNNSPSSASTITPPRLDRLYLGGYDKVDYYKFNASVQHRLTIEAYFNSTDTIMPRLFLNLTLYDPSGIPRSWTGYSDYAVLTCVVDTEGQWYIRVCPESDLCGFYSLSFTLQPNGVSNDPTFSGP